jgi:hypothetical protein
VKTPPNQPPRQLPGNFQSEIAISEFKSPDSHSRARFFGRGVDSAQRFGKQGMSDDAEMLAKPRISQLLFDKLGLATRDRGCLGTFRRAPPTGLPQAGPVTPATGTPHRRLLGRAWALHVETCLDMRANGLGSAAASSTNPPPVAANKVWS